MSSSNVSQLVIKMLTKTGCTLCEQNIPFLKALKKNFPEASFKLVNIDRMPEYAQHKNEVPVILINEQVFSKFQVNHKLLEEAITFKYKKLKDS